MEYMIPKTERLKRPKTASSVRRPYSARSERARKWLDESPQTTARTMESSDQDTSRTLEDFFNDDDDEEEQEEWVTKVNEATTVKGAMKALFEYNSETFYLYGHEILKMIEYRFKHNLDEVEV